MLWTTQTLARCDRILKHRPCARGCLNAEADQNEGYRGPGWSGTLPNGMTEYKSSTGIVWVLGRTAEGRESAILAPAAGVPVMS